MTVDTERRSFSAAEIANRNSIGIATVWRHIASHKLKAHKLGARTIIFVEDEAKWLESLPSANAQQVPR